MLNVACFVQSCLTDADFVIFSNYCLIGTRRKPSVFFYWFSLQESAETSIAKTVTRSSAASGKL